MVAHDSFARIRPTSAEARPRAKTASRGRGAGRRPRDPRNVSATFDKKLSPGMVTLGLAVSTARSCTRPWSVCWWWCRGATPPTWTLAAWPRRRYIPPDGRSGVCNKGRQWVWNKPTFIAYLRATVPPARGPAGSVWMRSRPQPRHTPRLPAGPSCGPTPRSRAARSPTAIAPNWPQPWSTASSAAPPCWSPSSTVSAATSRSCPPSWNPMPSSWPPTSRMPAA